MTTDGAGGPAEPPDPSLAATDPCLEDPDDLRNALDPIVRAAAIRQFAIHGLTTLEETLHALNHAEPYMRWTALDILVRDHPGESQTLPLFLHALRNDPNPDVRDTAALKIGDLDTGEEVVAALTDALSDTSHGVRWSASFSLFQLGLGPEPGDFSPEGIIDPDEPCG